MRPPSAELYSNQNQCTITVSCDCAGGRIHSSVDVHLEECKLFNFREMVNLVTKRQLMALRDLQDRADKLCTP